MSDTGLATVLKFKVLSCKPNTKGGRESSCFDNLIPVRVNQSSRLDNRRFRILTKRLICFCNLFVHNWCEFRTFNFFTGSRQLRRSQGCICLTTGVIPLPFWLFLSFVPFWRKHASQFDSTWVHQSANPLASIWLSPMCFFNNSLWLSLKLWEVSTERWVRSWRQAHFKRNRSVVRNLRI